MKIAYVLYPEVIVSNRSNGIRSQAETWANILRNEGVTVDCINNWDNYNWADYDVIHLFGYGKWIYEVSKTLSAINSSIVCSPILDPVVKKYTYDIYGIMRRLQTVFHNRISWGYSELMMSLPYIKMFLTRSRFESDFLHNAFGVNFNKIKKVPLSYSSSCIPFHLQNKENFCLHISSLFQERKNVLRLVEAAKIYGFNLILAGNCGTDAQFLPIKKAIQNCSNIKVLGYISEKEKIDLYKRAKVFVLPSIREGVGIVALDAAYYGCEIAITNIPGPKEYYEGKCVCFNPYDINEIGKSIMMLMNGSVSYQPLLGKEISDKYSSKTIAHKLISLYSSLD